jgi:hypothetical protein
MTTDSLTDESKARQQAKEMSLDGSVQYVIYSASGGGYFVDQVNMTYSDEEVITFFKSGEELR